MLSQEFILEDACPGNAICKRQKCCFHATISYEEVEIAGEVYIKDVTIELARPTPHSGPCQAECWSMVLTHGPKEPPKIQFTPKGGKQTGVEPPAKPTNGYDFKFWKDDCTGDVSKDQGKPYKVTTSGTIEQLIVNLPLEGTCRCGHGPHWIRPLNVKMTFDHRKKDSLD